MSTYEPHAEMFLGAAWTAITDRVFKRGSLRHTRGSRSAVVLPDASACSPQLNNKDGAFSQDNPLSPYYGDLGLNTAFRVSARAGTPAMDLTGASTDRAETPDVAALDVTGDIDVRVDATLANWTGYTNSANTVHLVGKLGLAAGTKSWFLGTRDGLLYWEWSADGTNVLSASSTVSPPVASNGRQAIRVTMDVDNGASGRTITFYTAATLTGPWAQLGGAVVQSGTTSVFNSATALRVGQATDVGFTPPLGRFTSLEVRNGIAGTVVANPDFSAQPVGTTSFTDGAGRLWTLGGAASITDRRVRLHHEMAALPTRWHVSGKDVWVEAQSAGVLRRLGRGNKPLKSALRRRIPSYGPLAYWPLEEGSQATQASSPISGVRPLKLTPANWAADESLVSSSPLPTINSGTSTPCKLFGRVPAPSGTLTEWGVQWMYRLDTGPATERTFMRILSTGTVSEWYILQSNGSGSTVFGRDSDGATVFTQGIATGTNIFGQWIKMEFNAVQNGANVDWHIGWIELDGSAGAIDGSFAGTVGRPTGVASPPDGYSADLDGMALGHISVWASDDTAAFDNAISGWAGETAGARMRRLATEENLPLRVNGSVATQMAMGPQRPRTVLGLIEECADADGGILYEERGRAFLRYRDRNTLYNQPAALVLDYTAPGLAPPLEPTPDDQDLTNDVTVTREDGASGQAVRETGRLSVQAPPDGVGIGYDTAVTLNLNSDEQAESIAYWRLHLGTVEGPRYPSVHVMLHRASALADQILAVDIGDKIRITNPPAWLPPGDIELIVQGVEETLDEFTWDVVFSCTPASPWTVGVVGDDVLGKVDTDGSELAAPATDTATTVDVLTTDGIPWTNDSAEYPWDVRVGGEVMRFAGAGRLLNPNPYFETDATGWLASNCTIAGSTAVVHPQGVASLLITPNGVSAAGGVEETPRLPVSSIIPGASYVASCWVYSPGGWSDLRACIDWYDSANTFISTGLGSASVVPAGQWTFLQQTLTAPANASRAAVRARHGGTPAGGDIWYVWALRITQPKASWLHDAFGRAVASTWGTSDSGLTWTTVGGGAASDYSVGSGYAVHVLSTVDVSRRTAVTAVHPDFDLYCDVTTSALATGDSLFGGPTARMLDASNMYQARLEFTTGNAVVLSVRKILAGVNTAVGGTYTLPGAHVAGTFVRVRFQGMGTMFRAKAWLASAREPDPWHVEGTDGSITAANPFGTRSIRVTGNTNAATVAVQYDNVEVINPQTFTVTRGLVKAHAAATDVRLAHPAIVAL